MLSVLFSSLHFQIAIDKELARKALGNATSAAARIPSGTAWILRPVWKFFFQQSSGDRPYDGNFLSRASGMIDRTFSKYLALLLMVHRNIGLQISRVE